MAELKKCPFCGSEGKVIKGVGAMYMVFCNNENCSASVGLFKETPSEAIEAWNNRATESEIRAKAYEEVFELLRSKRDKKTMKVNLDDLEIRKYKEQLKGE